MEVSRTQNSEAQAAQAQQGVIDQDKKGRTKTLQKEEKLDTSKPASLSVLDKRTDPKEIAEAFTNRLSDAQILSPSSNKAMQEQIQNTVDLFKEDHETKMQDQVVLTASVSVQQPTPIKPKKETERTQLDPREAALEKDSSSSAQAEALGKPISSALRTETTQKNQEVIKETLKKYISSFSETIINDNPQKTQEKIQLGQTLQKLGVSQETLKQAERNTEKFVRADLRQQLKQGFISLALTYNPKKMTQDMVIHSKKYEKLQEMGKNLGLLDDAMDQDNLKNAAKDELRSVLTDELDQALIEKKINSRSPKELVKAFNEFNELANISKFEPGDYIRKLNKKLDNLGLNYFMNPLAKAPLDTDTGSGQQKKNQQERFNEIESIEDQLRTMFMTQVIKRDIKSAFATRYNIFKLKSALKKTGEVTEGTFERLEEEGRALAKLKLLDLLQESFEERATLPELAGAAYGLVKKKMKTSLSGLKVLRAAPSKGEIDAIKDQVNKAIFSVVKEEYIKVEVFIEANPKVPSLLQKRKEYLAILNRLKKETQILEDIRPKQFKDMPLTSETNVIEAA